MCDMCCKVCKNEKANKIYWVKERRLNRGEKFRYLLCAQCGTLQLIDSVENMVEYYRSYSIWKDNYQESRGIGLIEKRIKAWLYLEFIPDKGLCNMSQWEEYRWLYPLKDIRLHRNSKILDVGCGSGRWLRQLKELGYVNLYAIDKYAPSIEDKKINFVQGDISDAIDVGGYDLITLHHSFEHMETPFQVLEEAKEKLAKNGLLLIRIPVMGSEAWKRYETDWYQIDAPRHIFLYSVKAMKYLCRKVGLKVCKVKFDSIAEQFTISEGYKLTDRNYDILRGYKRNQKKKFAMEADILNNNGLGDQAIFYVKRR